MSYKMFLLKKKETQCFKNMFLLFLTTFYKFIRLMKKINLKKLKRKNKKKITKKKITKKMIKWKKNLT